MKFSRLNRIFSLAKSNKLLLNNLMFQKLRSLEMTFGSKVKIKEVLLARETMML
jgi:hypothetical protein